MGSNKDLRVLKFEELKIRIEHYKYYLKLALEANAFFYVITGGVLGYYLQQPANTHLEFFLLLPMLIGAVLGGIFIHGADLQRHEVKTIKEIKRDLQKLKLVVKPIPDTHLLLLLLLIFGYIFFIVGILLILVPLIRASFVRSRELWIFAVVGGLVLILGGFARRIFAWKFNISPDFGIEPRTTKESTKPVRARPDNQLAQAQDKKELNFEDMSQAAKSLFVFGIYLFGLGLILLFVPNLILQLFGVTPTNEVWIRLNGMFVLCLSFYY
ncbi:MAG: hypothetical protein WBP93_02585, partial [Pyrinomonadaceae bacterium]